MISTTLPSPSSPIHSLPGELLREIFFHVCKGYPILIEVGEFYGRRSSGDRGSRVFVLSLVCWQWRDLVVEFGKLWSYLEFDIGPASEDQTDYELDSRRCHRLTELCLERAVAAPLRLSFMEYRKYGRSAGEEWESAGFDLALGALCRHAAQWLSVEFCVGEKFLERNAPTLLSIRGYLHSLEELRSIGDSESTTYWVTDFISGPCPSLRHVIFGENSRPQPDNRLPTLLLTWGKLERLSLDPPPTPYSIFDIVPFCSNLEHLELGIYSPELAVSFGNTIRPMSWHNLQTLLITSYVCGHDWEVFDDFFRSVTLPSLICLQIKHFDGVDDCVLSEQQEDGVKGFFQRSGASITSLILTDLPFTAELAAAFLPHLPNLTTLSIDIWDSPPSETIDTISTPGHLLKYLLIDSLLRGPGLRPFLPHLVKLEIGVERGSTSHEEFVAAVRSRWFPDPETSARLGVDSLRVVKVNLFTRWGEPMTPIPESLQGLKNSAPAGHIVDIS